MDSRRLLKLLHLERNILLHGHERLDTDSTPTLIGEDGLMNIRCMQAGGVEAPPAYDEKRLVWNEVKGQPWGVAG